MLFFPKNLSSLVIKISKLKVSFSVGYVIIY